MIIVYNKADGMILKSGTFDAALNTPDDHLWIKVDDITEVRGKKVNVETHELEDYVQPITWTDVRNKRNDMLNRTDYLMIIDFPITDEERDEVKKFRQALRDLPDQGDDPSSIVFPDPPQVVLTK